MDSDNDGLTNGEELGDPNCIWEFGQRPEYSETRGHPGEFKLTMSNLVRRSFSLLSKFNPLSAKRNCSKQPYLI